MECSPKPRVLQRRKLPASGGGTVFKHPIAHWFKSTVWVSSRFCRFKNCTRSARVVNRLAHCINTTTKLKAIPPLAEPCHATVCPVLIPCYATRWRGRHATGAILSALSPQVDLLQQWLATDVLLLQHDVSQMAVLTDSGVVRPVSAQCLKLADKYQVFFCESIQSLQGRQVSLIVGLDCESWTTLTTQHMHCTISDVFLTFGYAVAFPSPAWHYCFAIAMLPMMLCYCHAWPLHSMQSPMQKQRLSIICNRFL